MSDISTRRAGRTGRITFTRPKALNALSPPMSEAIEQALLEWEADPGIGLIVIDAEGERAFCAGGDIADIHRHGMQGDHDFARAFWRQEYRMNARLARYPKPVAAFMQGFCMGGGVGVGCHVGHRVAGETTQIAMPECGIGLIPDVGGTLLLARAPGRLGEYLGLTGARMGAGDAIHAGFADHFIPEGEWPDLIARLEEEGDPALIAQAARPAPEAPLQAAQPQIDRLFAGETVAEIIAALEADGTGIAEAALPALTRNAPLSMACTLELVRRARDFDAIGPALEQEYRFTHRVQEHGDLLEGVRAQIIDKDRQPKWRHATADDVTPEEVAAMLAPLGDDALKI